MYVKWPYIQVCSTMIITCGQVQFAYDMSGNLGKKLCIGYRVVGPSLPPLDW